MKLKLLLYCCKEKPYLNCDFGKDNHEEYSGNWNIYLANKQDECSNIVNGKIVAECDFGVEEIYIGKSYGFPRNIEIVYTDSLRQPIYLSQKSCLKLEDICEYLNHKGGYAIHIKNLHIFDEPKELSEYFTNEKKVNTLDGYSWVCGSIDRAPQNMMYCYHEGEKKILMSIKPESLCKILNGEKTVEIRKKVLKDML